MTWLHAYDLLKAQTAYLPISHIEPFAPLPKEWPAIEKLLRKEEKVNLEVIEKAIDQFIQYGSWPENLSPRVSVLIRSRINYAMDTALRLSVLAISPQNILGNTDEIPDSHIFSWLLFQLWKTLGQDAWIADLSCTFNSVHHQTLN